MTKVVIITSGPGSRLRLLTNKEPKSFLKIGIKNTN